MSLSLFFFSPGCSKQDHFSSKRVIEGNHWQETYCWFVAWFRNPAENVWDEAIKSVVNGGMVGYNYQPQLVIAGFQYPLWWMLSTIVYKHAGVSLCWKTGSSRETHPNSCPWISQQIWVVLCWGYVGDFFSRETTQNCRSVNNGKHHSSPATKQKKKQKKNRDCKSGTPWKRRFRTWKPWFLGAFAVSFNQKCFMGPNSQRPRDP